MRLVWSDRALRDVAEIRGYVAPRHRLAAARLIRRLASAVQDVLRTTPYARRPGRVEGTREFVVARTPYVMAYTIGGENVAVIHGARQRPSSF